MRRLVALDLPAGGDFVAALQAVWNSGDAAFPLDRRLPDPARKAVLERVAASAVIGSEGTETALKGGRSVDEGDALVVATSGTTGEPKGAVLTHAGIEAAARITSARLGVDPGRDRWLACIPLAHVGGLSVVTRALLTGTALTVLPAFDAKAVEDEARRGATLVSLVATALARIDPGCFRTILLGGAAPPDQLPSNVVTTYGLTETVGGVVYDGAALDGVEISLGDNGEILLKSPTLARCYRAGAEDLPLAGTRGFFDTGDIGRLVTSAGESRLEVHGRADEMIVTGGEKVWPDPVERVIATHPLVAEVAITGFDDPEWGQRVVAFVVPNDPSSPPDADELRALVKEQLAPWSAPREVRLVKSLPRTPSGKTRRSVLTADPDLPSRGPR